MGIFLFLKCFVYLYKINDMPKTDIKSIKETFYKTQSILQSRVKRRNRFLSRLSVEEKKIVDEIKTHIESVENSLIIKKENFSDKYNVSYDDNVLFSFSLSYYRVDDKEIVRFTLYNKGKFTDIKQTNILLKLTSKIFDNFDQEYFNYKIYKLRKNIILIVSV